MTDDQGASRVGWLATAVLVAVAVGSVLAMPGPLDERLAAVLRGVCAQRPAHAVGFTSGPVVLEARMLGIFAGFALVQVSTWWGGRWRRTGLPRGIVGAALLGAIGLLAADGINAVVFDLQGAAAYAPRNDLRLLSGTLGGIGVASFVLPMVAFVFWRHQELAPLFATWSELFKGFAAGMGLVLAVGGGWVSGVALGVVAAVAVVLSLWAVSTYVAVLAWRGPGQINGPRELGGYAAAGLVLLGLELWGLSAIRVWLETTLGIVWVV